MLALVLWLALGLRLSGIAQQSIWYDEGLSIYSARGSLRDILHASAASEHPPLHALLLSLWMHACGDSEFSVRYLSTWWGILGVALVARLGHQLAKNSGKGSATLAALLMAASPIAIWYAQETRGYTMALALATAAVIVGDLSLSPAGDHSLAPATDTERAHGPRWAGSVGYVVLAAAALYTHLYSAFVLVALNLALAARHVRALARREMRWRLTWAWIGAQGIVLALLVPWLPTIAAQWQLNATYFHGAVDWKQIVRRTVLALSVGETLQGFWATGAASAFLLLAACGIVALDRRPSSRRSLLLLGLWITIPVLAQIALNRRLPKFSPRYMLNMLPPLLLAAAEGGAWLFQHLQENAATREQDKPARTAAVAVAMAALLAATALIGGATTRSLGNQTLDPSQYRPDIRAVAHYIEAHATRDDVIVLLAGHNAPAFTYYYRGAIPIVALPDKLLPDTRTPLDVQALRILDDATGGKSRLWLVLWQESLADPTGLITDELEHTYPRLGVGRTFHDVALLLFDVRSGARLAQAELPQTALNADFWADDRPGHSLVRLTGYDLDRREARAGDTLYLYLYWQALAEMQHDYKVFTQLVGAGNAIVAQHDKIAGAAAYPTSHWPPGALVRDRFLLTVAADAAPGPYTLIAGLYRPGQETTRLRIQGADRDHVVLAEINIK